MQRSYKHITGRIKSVVKDVDPSAEVILYGSRARGDAKKDSDWDLLILINKPHATAKDEQLFRHKLFELELDTAQAISTFVYGKKDWETRFSVTPLYQNIKSEGIYL